MKGTTQFYKCYTLILNIFEALNVLRHTLWEGLGISIDTNKDKRVLNY